MAVLMKVPNGCSRECSQWMVLNGCSRGCSQWMYSVGVPNGCSHGRVHPRVRVWPPAHLQFQIFDFAHAAACEAQIGPNLPLSSPLLSLSLSFSLARAQRVCSTLYKTCCNLCFAICAIGTTTTVMGVCGDATAACCALQQQVPRAAALGLAGASGRTTLGTLGSGGGGGRQFGVRVSGSLLPHTLSRGGGGASSSSSSSRLGSSRRRESRRSWQTLMLAHLLKQLPCEVRRSAGGQVLVRAAGDSSSSGN